MRDGNIGECPYLRVIQEDAFYILFEDSQSSFFANSFTVQNCFITMTGMWGSTAVPVRIIG